MSTTRILQITDLHLFKDDEQTLKGIPTRRTLQAVVTQLQQEPDFDHVIITGDHTHDELPDSYQAVRDLLAPWLDRLFVVPGNHDDRSVMRDVLSDIVSRQQPASACGDDRINFQFRCGNWLCLGLDTHSPGNVPGQFGQTQADWLREQLAAHGDQPSLLFCHHPPVDIPSDWMDPIGLTDRQLLIDVVQDFPAVQMICCGHVHHASQGYAGGTSIVTTPSTGIQFDPQGTQPTFSDQPPGYRIIELSAANLKTRVVTLPHAEYTPCDE